jgi:CRISPR/Cas system-associated protein Csx1
MRLFSLLLAPVDPQVSRNYADTMSKIFTAHFKNYIQALAKLAYSTAKRGDLIGVPEEQRKSTSALFFFLLFFFNSSFLEY